MTVALFRFYEELNDFIAPQRRQREFEFRCARAASVKNAIEAIGVPHSEVELIIANGESVNFSYRVRDGDRISVYPMFESFDVQLLLRVRTQPLRVPRFVADAHLGGLARMLGARGRRVACRGAQLRRARARRQRGAHRRQRGRYARPRVCSARDGRGGPDPLSHRNAAAERINDVFEQMAQGRISGRVVLSMP